MQTPRFVYRPAHGVLLDGQTFALVLLLSLLALGAAATWMVSEKNKSHGRRVLRLKPPRGRQLLAVVLAALTLAAAGGIAGAGARPLRTSNIPLVGHSADRPILYTSRPAALKAARAVRNRGATARQYVWEHRPGGLTVCDSVCTHDEQPAQEVALLTSVLRQRYGLTSAGATPPLSLGSELNPPSTVTNDSVLAARQGPTYITHDGKKVTCSVTIDHIVHNPLGYVFSEHIGYVVCIYPSGPAVAAPLH